MGIELPPLNTDLVKVHRELAKVSIGAKDMATKNKNAWKTIKLTQDQLQKANERITQLEKNVTTATTIPTQVHDNNAANTLWEELGAQKAILAKAKKATQMAETEIDRLRAELRQSSDREADARVKGRQAVKTLEGKLQAEVAMHNRTKEEYEKLREEANKKDAAITGLWELAEKKKAWYDKQLVDERA